MLGGVSGVKGCGSAFPLATSSAERVRASSTVLLPTTHHGSDFRALISKPLAFAVEALFLGKSFFEMLEFAAALTGENCSSVAVEDAISTIGAFAAKIASSFFLLASLPSSIVATCMIKEGVERGIRSG